MTQSCAELPNRLVSAANGVDYAYRDADGHLAAVPLMLLQHFRGNLDSWDPAPIDALASSRRVITFDCAGSAHGFLFQHHDEFAADVTEFLS
jgi:pimeloyl-ACP methyl ester carboxylesterase